jgi:hypothetical protein
MKVNKSISGGNSHITSEKPGWFTALETVGQIRDHIVSEMTGQGHKIFGMFHSSMSPVKLQHDFK